MHTDAVEISNKEMLKFSIYNRELFVENNVTAKYLELLT